VTKAFGRRGDFYRIAGDKARAIDGPTNGTIPPYDRAVVLGPTRPAEVAARVKRCSANVQVAVVDINDIGGTFSARRSTRRGASARAHPCRQPAGPASTPSASGDTA
jgi:hypothetical protein